MTTKTITITDLADVQAGDMVTAEYVPCGNTGAAIISGIAYKGASSGSLLLAEMVLRHTDGAHGAVLRFVSATREVPAWEPGEDLCDWLADQLEDYEAFGGEAWDSASAILTHMHNTGWLNDSPAESEPVDPVLDENDKRNRIDCNGGMCWWSERDAVWVVGDCIAVGNLAALDRHYGPLTFADEEAEA